MLTQQQQHQQEQQRNIKVSFFSLSKIIKNSRVTKAFDSELVYFISDIRVDVEKTCT